ncbi:hypothetical protein WICPIJ_005248 [Wickerhamomyces pijperi]|uniref:Uncharacterized protein n=1 Tax=Wickerhamomyces pijperi TaxID=599730 RepID=A0A9P8Q3W2_WICPI|nr:hypothetical protein WICPIJ_005248 [Wickerhamomyces pijperi]
MAQPTPTEAGKAIPMDSGGRNVGKLLGDWELQKWVNRHSCLVHDGVHLGQELDEMGVTVDGLTNLQVISVKNDGVLLEFSSVLTSVHFVDVWTNVQHQVRADKVLMDAWVGQQGALIVPNELWMVLRD